MHGYKARKRKTGFFDYGVIGYGDDLRVYINFPSGIYLMDVAVLFQYM